MAKSLSLDIPLIRQIGEYDCLPACSAMVLAAYGGAVSVGRLAKEMGTRTCSGTEFDAAALCLLQRGFDVLRCGWEKDLPNRLLCLSEAEARPRLLRWLKSDAAKRRWKTREIHLLLAFLEAGGRCMPRPVTLGQMRTAMSRGIPTILDVNIGLLMPIRDKKTLHVIIPVKIGDKCCTVNDPYRSPHGGIQEYPTWQLMFANQYAGGHALFVYPKEAVSSPGGHHGR